MPDAFWSAARAQMLLDPTVTNLNTGSFGPLPRCVFDRATELRQALAAEKAGALSPAEMAEIDALGLRV